MTLVRWRPKRELDPFALMENLQSQINRVFNTSLTDWPGVSGWGTSFPLVDVYEDKDNVIVTAEVPGLEQKDVELSITGNTVTLKGEKKHVSERKEESYQRIERSYGSFQRVIELPCEVNADKAKAKLDNGVLAVTLPKSEAHKPKQITIAAK
ncbi:MAG: Hsp20/alpha crystallin family protein [Verrucomicrobia bacterium]|nr:Hsp20/alpha crystallin family protein [Verrucomicrobiota bacterium]